MPRNPPFQWGKFRDTLHIARYQSSPLLILERDEMGRGILSRIPYRNSFSAGGLYCPSPVGGSFLPAGGISGGAGFRGA